jgi:3,4-dihydroxy 2-butanone 4-phosphate synthase/GTP cyclohydrolase II
MAADKVTPEAINFMATHGRGLICLSMTRERVSQLGLPMMAANNQSPYETAFTVSVEAREGVSTGISAHDRAHTIKVAIDPEKGPRDLVVPGHIFPLKARDGGVLVRAGQTEGSVDLARMAGCHPSGVICEVMNDDGTMARMPDLERFAAEHRLHIVTIADMIKWRLRNERLVDMVFEGRIPVPELGEFKARVYRSQTDGGLHLAMWRGPLTGEVTVRVQAADPVADVFRATSSDGAAQLEGALGRIAAEGGLLLYLHVAGGRSQDSLLGQIKAHLLPPEGEERKVGPGVRAVELREFGVGAQILVDLGVRRIKLLTNNPRKIVALEAFGLEVVERLSLEVPMSAANRDFLEAKRNELGHLLNLSNE